MDRPRSEPANIAGGVRPTFATLATTSHLHLAATLADSLRGAHPDCDVLLLWVDAPAANVRADVAEEFGFWRVLAPKDILHPDELTSLRTRYDTTELCFALKPVLIGHLVRAGFPAVIYLDADIFVYRALTAVLHALETHSIVLTPHLTQPLPEDGRNPRDVTILRSGSFNLGFIAVKNSGEGSRFLDWWQDRAARYGYVDPSLGWGGDQKWCDLAPALFDGVLVLKNTGCNVGYWNLPSRPLTDEGNGIRAGDEPLLFFHFSGFSADKPVVLSRFQDRLDASEDPVLTRLLRDYAAKVRGSLDALGRILANLGMPEHDAEFVRSTVPTNDPGAIPPRVFARGTFTLPVERILTDGRAGRLDLPRGIVHVRQFMPFHGEQFLIAAYQTVLLRAPDSAGLRSFGLALAEGAMCRVQVLGRLRLSAEGRKVGAKVDGLRLALALASLYRLPIAGPLAALVARWLRLPLYLQDLGEYDRRLAQIIGAAGGLPRQGGV